MRVFAIDDEALLLEQLHDAIAQAAPGAEILDFRRASAALEAVSGGLCPDVVFSDIQMPDMDGLHLALRIKSASPQTRFVFVTGYEEYALEAWRQHAHGYLMKPVSAQDIREALDHLPSPPPEKGALSVRCFGDFAVFWQGEPLSFARRKTPELLALLIDRRGAPCSAEELAAVLWEDQADMAAAKHSLRALVQDLRHTLSAIGMEDVLLRRRGLLAIRVEQVDCDYYRLLSGDAAAVNEYHGHYMRQYSWAEATAGTLYFRQMQNEK